MNRDFDETYTAKAGLRSVLFMIFNPVRDELITGGVGGTEVNYFTVSLEIIGFWSIFCEDIRAI